MTEWIELLGIRTWEGLWLPVLIWTLPALLVWLVVRHERIAPGVRIQLIQATLLALPVALALAAFRRATSAIEYTVLSVPMPVPVPSAPIAAAPAAYSVDPFWTVVGCLTILMIAGGLLGIIRLTASAVSLHRLRQSSRAIADQGVDQIIRARAADIGFDRRVEIRRTPGINTPMSTGILAPVILIPDSERGDLDLIVLHELVHHRRRDVFRVVVTRIIRSVFLAHPLMHALGSRLDTLVEIDCDTEVVATNGVSPKAYAALLLRYAVPGSTELLALKLGSEPSLLKRRIEAMQHPVTTLRSHPVAVILGVLLLGVLTTFAACTDSLVGTDADPAESAESTLSPKVSRSDGEVFVIVEEMPTLIGGLEELQSRIQYPDLARRAGVEGRVYVQFVVNSGGVPEDIIVVRGIGAGADEEAVRAVSTMRFEPGRQRGQIVPVKMSLPVSFRLNAQSGEQQTSMVSRAGLTKMSGRVMDAQGNPVMFASIQLEGTNKGAATDENGNFFILAEPGEYDVRVSGQGFETRIVKTVSLQSGITRQLDVTLEQ